jgi:hypothetical protein
MLLQPVYLTTLLAFVATWAIIGEILVHPTRRE